jgi:hypothetical protein
MKLTYLVNLEHLWINSFNLSLGGIRMKMYGISHLNSRILILIE